MEEGEDKFLQYYGLEVDISHRPTDDILRLLENYVLGTEGALRYRQMDIRERLSAIREIWFMSLRKSGRVLGTVGFVRRNAHNGNQSVNSYYIRYFSIRLSWARKRRQASAVKKSLKKKSTRGNVIKEQVAEFMGHIEHYLKGVDQEASVLYAYIEKENIPSMQMSGRMGYETVRQISHTYFSRFFPKSYPRITGIRDDEKPLVLEKIRNFYRDYTLFQEEPLFYKDRYLVYRNEKENIVAGVQFLPVNWEMIEIRGVTGWVFRKIFPLLPFLRRLYDGLRFRFAGFEGLFYEEGYEKVVPQLFEVALHRCGLSLGMIWYDTRSPLAAMMRCIPHKGFFSWLVKPVPAEVRMRFLNMSSGDSRLYYEKPVYISTFDLT